jgi:rubrerythrin
MLSGAGFDQVFSMSGGIDAWNGLQARGAPEAGMAIFSDADKPEDLVALAWILEEGSRRFYEGVAGLLKDVEAGNLFRQLVRAEEQHKQALLRAYQEICGSEPVSEFLKNKETEDLMEGGARVSQALTWASGKDEWELLQFSMALETNALDLYLKMIRRVKDKKASRIFETLSREERSHLEKLGELLESRV